MQRILAIAGLTWKAALRFRLFLVLAALLLAAVVGLPILIKDDGTAQGFTQILLTYTLSAITGLLGLSTLWLACGTLARDIEECQIQIVATKPVARWQIWLGKWLGIMSLNAALLVLSGASIYGLLEWRAARLPAAVQTKLRDEVLVARGAAREQSWDKEIEAETQRQLEEWGKKNPNPISAADLLELKHRIREQLKAELTIVPPTGNRYWQIDLSAVKDQVKDHPLQLRVKFNSAQNIYASGTYIMYWQVGDPNSPQVWRSEPMSLAADTFHEFEVPANLLDDKGMLHILLYNPNNTALLFSLDEGLEVLYHEGSFGLNYIRGLGIIFCWMALLAALGLAAASFLSFPVAAFFSLAVLTVGLSTGTMTNVVTTGSITGTYGTPEEQGNPMVNAVAVTLCKGLLAVINLAKDFSPIDALSTGRSITWVQLGRAVAQIIGLMGGLLALAGISLFYRRELAAAQGTQ